MSWRRNSDLTWSPDRTVTRTETIETFPDSGVASVTARPLTRIWIVLSVRAPSESLGTWPEIGPPTLNSAIAHRQQACRSLRVEPSSGPISTPARMHALSVGRRYSNLQQSTVHVRKPTDRPILYHPTAGFVSVAGLQQRQDAVGIV